MYNNLTNNEFETKDFYLTVLLMERGFSLVDSLKKEGDNRTVYFKVKIHNKELFDKTIIEFLNHNVNVEMNKFIRISGKLRHELDKWKYKN